MNTLDDSIVSAIQKCLEEALAISIANPLSQEELSKKILGLKFTEPDMSISPEVIQAFLQGRLPDPSAWTREKIDDNKDN